MTGRRFANSTERWMAYALTDGLCAICGSSLIDSFHVDHRQPFSKGGETELSNLQATCPKCNLSKGASMPTYHDFLSVSGSLRKGQMDLFNAAVTTNKDKLTGVLPTGYGKTLTAMGVYGILRARGIVDRMLVLVPTDQQRAQFAAKAKDLSAKLGIQISGAMSVQKLPAEFRYHWNDKVEIFVASYQQVNRDDTFFNTLTTKGKWLIFRDEVHHLAEEQAWGRSASNLRGAFLLNLTATPIRTDKRFVSGLAMEQREDGGFDVVADVTVSLKDAIEEEACRRPHGIVQHYHIDVQMDGSPDIVRLKTEDLKDEIKDFDTFETRRRLRYCNKYLSKILLDAVGRLDEKNLLHPGQHQMLVFAMSCNHAEAVCEQINALTRDPENGNTKFADWIGVKRSAKENADVLDRYMENKLPCLIQVDKAGEGFDNLRCSVLVFLHLIRADAKLIQQIGRGLRRNHAIKKFSDDTCHVYASADSPIGDFVENLETELGLGPKRNTAADGREQDGRTMDLFDIPGLNVVSAEWYQDEHVGLGAARVAPIRERARRAGLPDDIPIDALMRFLGGMGADDPVERQSQPPKADETMNVRFYQDQVKKATSTLAGNICRVISNGSFEKSLLGDIKRLIHTEWRRVSGLGHKEMTSDEYQRKYEWLKRVNESVRKTMGVPAWARP